MKTINSFVRRILLLTVLVAAGEWVSGQQPSKQMSNPPARGVVTAVQPADIPAPPSQSGGTVTLEKYEGIRSGIYLWSGWKPAVIILRDGSEFQLDQVRYNLLTQKMEFVRDNEVVALSASNDLQRVIFPDQQFIYSEFVNAGGQLQKGFLELLTEGRCCLYRRWKASYWIRDEQQDEQIIYRTQTFYIRHESQIPIEVGVDIRSFCESFGQYASDIRSLARQEGLKLKNPEHLIRMVNYYNQLAAH